MLAIFSAVSLGVFSMKKTKLNISVAVRMFPKVVCLGHSLAILQISSPSVEHSRVISELTYARVLPRYFQIEWVGRTGEKESVENEDCGCAIGIRYSIACFPNSKITNPIPG